MLNVRDFSPNKEVKAYVARNTAYQCLFNNNLKDIFTN